MHLAVDIIYLRELTAAKKEVETALPKKHLQAFPADTIITVK